MDKNAVKKYAVWARRELIIRVSQRAAKYGITVDNTGNAADESVNGVLLTTHEKYQRTALINKINHNGYNKVIEEVAYTWFNRFTALRFMEVNGYLPSHVRVFTNEENEFKPQILAEAIELELEGLNMEKVFALKNENSTDELYKYLVITQCNALYGVLPEIFQKIDDYTELLFPDNLLREGSVIEQMISQIDEVDWRDQVQIIGWLYQYYNSEPKDKVFAALKKNVKISKENIPAATQLFTPDWIVRYMVENSLGRLWADGHRDFDRGEWKYYLEEAEQEESVNAQLNELRAESKNLNPEDIRFIDPCMGSGHILVYAFDVLMQIYLSQGYTERDAASLIIEKNLYGADIDRRAYQLSYFALMMKGRAYDRRFLTRNVKPNLCNFQEIAEINPDNLTGELGLFARQFANCDTYGSLIEVKPFDTEKLSALIEDYEENLETLGYRDILEKMLAAYRIFAQKYDVCCTNPPYMGGSGMDAKLTDYVKSKFPDSKSDLFACFIERCGQLAKAHGFYAMITQHAWMFLSSYEKLREKLLCKTTVNMAHLGARAFDEIGGEVVQTTAFVNFNSHIKDYKGTYARLVDIVGENEKKEAFLSGDCRHTAKQENFSKIPGAPVAYWVSENFIMSFENPRIDDKYDVKTGLQTGDNNKYLKLWFEVNYGDIDFFATQESDYIKKWYPHTKGGSYRKWYGNFEYVILWENNGAAIKNEKGAVIRSPQFYFLGGITWSHTTSIGFSGRLLPEHFIINVESPSVFMCNNTEYVMGMLNSKVADLFFKVMNGTFHYLVGNIATVPIKLSNQHLHIVNSIVQHNITLSKTDWDSFETSWDFAEHPLVRLQSSLWDATATGAAMQAYYGEHIKVSCPVELCYMLWQGECNQRFNQLKANEEELNRIFIDIYGLQDELTPEVEDKDVTVRKADLQREIKSLISYAVGCMFGRYSLDKEGLVFAGGEWDERNYRRFIPDADNIIPITDEEYFSDDIVGRFVEFIRVVYGDDSLEENLKFIAEALGGKSQPRDVIRNYFLNDFFNDHCKIYQKRPIYWLFDSGKKNGFKALIYMHRYRADTIARIRTDYVHEQQSRYSTTLEDLETRIASASTSERIKLSKQKKAIQEQAEELHLYEEKIHHLADQMIAIDLDDGVKVNYAKFQDVLAKIK